jgi:surfeit locus 1 family protein
MPPPRRTVGFIVFALAISLGCIRLGVWQLSRLAERRARNAVIAARIAAPRADVTEVARDTGSLRYRPLRATGRFDYINELLLAGRSRGGSPGTYLLTPLRFASSDTAVLVVRGWLYAPDAKSVELERWHEGTESVSIEGYADDFVSAKGPVVVPNAPRSLRVADFDSVRIRLPYPIFPFLLTQTSDSAERSDHPARLTLPLLDDGPHKMYALQWFVFALIAWVGVGAVVRKGRGGKT